MSVKIGKAPDNDFIIDNPHVSRQHAILKTLPDGTYLLEDLTSGNGTFVNGQQILRKKVTISDSINLGGEYEITLSEILGYKNDYTTEFESLKFVYEQYQSKKIKIQSSNQFKTRLLQSLPFTLPGIVGISLGISGMTSKEILYISLLITIVGPALGIFLAARQAAKMPELLQSFSDEFKTHYVCPKCGTFLGEIPWKSLKNKGKCSNFTCKASW